MARDVNGYTIMPGETFSIDTVVGPRTTSGGYVPAPYMVGGQGQCCAVGGGVSQFGTTMFNAAFWGGFPIVEHQPHSGWISRYPLGIEATLVYRSIDLEFTNDTLTPLTIRTYTSGTSVTVELWGFQGGWQISGSHPTGSRRSSLSVLDYGGEAANRVSASVTGSAPGTVKVVRVLTQNGSSSSQTWWWTYVS
jgi:vancomycin resistance protein YoaR